jgi:TPR repeat protein
MHSSFLAKDLREMHPLFLKYLKLAADHGHADSQYQYAMYLSTGDGIAMNKSLVAHDLKLSAEQEHVDAQYDYAMRLLARDGVAVNMSLAAHYLKLSAGRGNADAQ